MARAWASDDAAARRTLMALVGREILQHELRRIEIPKLRELIDEVRPSRARDLRTSLGLEVPPLAPAPKPLERRPSKPKAEAPPVKRTAVPAGSVETPARMPKPAFRAPAKPAPRAEPRRFTHPKFGEGMLESQDGVGAEAKLTIRFASGARTLLARYVTEVTG